MSISLVTAIFLSLIMLSGCNNNSPTSELNFTARHIQDCHFTMMGNRRGRTLTVVTSMSELEDFKDLVLEDDELGGRRVGDEAQNFIDEFARYNARFFSNRFLVIITFSEGRDAIYHRVESVRISEQNEYYTEITIIRTFSEATHHDSIRHHIIIELDNKDITPLYGATIYTVSTRRIEF